MVKDQHPKSVKEATTSILPVWLDAFKVLLNIDPKQEVENTPNWDGLAIRIQVFKVKVVFPLPHRRFSDSNTLHRPWIRSIHHFLVRLHLT